jgi:Icc-related predicted phosphoesterase
MHFIFVTTIFFDTDIHGTDVCWMKFLNAEKIYKSDMIILSGDLTGKAEIPTAHNSNQTYRAVFLEQQSITHADEELLDMIKKIKSRSYYPYFATLDELEGIFNSPKHVQQIFIKKVLTPTVLTSGKTAALQLLWQQSRQPCRPSQIFQPGSCHPSLTRRCAGMMKLRRSSARP